MGWHICHCVQTYILTVHAQESLTDFIDEAVAPFVVVLESQSLLMRIIGDAFVSLRVRLIEAEPLAFLKH